MPYISEKVRDSSSSRKTAKYKVAANKETLFLRKLVKTFKVLAVPDNVTYFIARRDKMETKLVKVSENTVHQAAEILKNGGIVAVPTETVYGLAANAYDIEAVRSVFRAKGRPQDNPLILHICSTDMLRDIAVTVSPLALRLAENFWPGPLTMIFPRKEHVPAETCGGLDTAAVRMPRNTFTLRLIEDCGFPLAAPSANTSGLPSPTSAGFVYDDMNGKIPMIVDGGECRFGVESTVICFEGENRARILRPGAVTPQMLRPYCDVVIDSGVLEKLPPDARVLSPGMKYKHYSPGAEVYILSGGDDAVSEFMKSNSTDRTGFLGYGDEKLPEEVTVFPYGKSSEEQAENLFASLRKADAAGCSEIYVRIPSDTDGMGLAVYNRLLRAAAFRIIKADGGSDALRK